MAGIRSNSLQTLDRALELLEVLSYAPAPMSVIELSKRLNINRTTIYAMLNSLVEGKYIRKDEVTGKYAVNYKMFELGQCYKRSFPFLRVAQTHTFALTEKWMLNSYVAIYIDTGEALLLADDYPIGIRMLYEGFKGPAYCTGIGKVLLAGFTGDDLERELCKMDFHTFTPNTITDREQLKRELQTVREQGYAFDNQEYVGGLACYAAPIKDSAGKTIASISISGEIERVIPNADGIIRDIVVTARSIGMM